MGLCFKWKQMDPTSVTKHAPALRWNRTLGLCERTQCGREKDLQKALFFFSAWNWRYLCHSQTFSRQLVNNSSETCFNWDTTLWFMRPHWILQCDNDNGDRTTHSLSLHSIDGLWGIPTHCIFTDLSCSTLHSTLHVFRKTMAFASKIINKKNKSSLQHHLGRH